MKDGKGHVCSRLFLGSGRGVSSGEGSRVHGGRVYCGLFKDPTYKDVCSGKTGHAEAVEIEYDPSRVSYEELLSVFWENHDPTTLNRQGPDIGTQYRSAIYVHTPEQKAAAIASKENLQKSGRYKNPISTEITPASQFYRAEDYHQQYVEKRGSAHRTQR